MKEEINGLIAEALRYQAERVSPAQPQLIDIFRMEDEFIDSLVALQAAGQAPPADGCLGQGGLSRALKWR